jgi:hypothetical protein
MREKSSLHPQTTSQEIFLRSLYFFRCFLNQIKLQFKCNVNSLAYPRVRLFE